VGLVLAAVFVCGEARAGAWPAPKGGTLAILKYERAEANEAFDLDGDRYNTAERYDEIASLYLEHGLSRRITVQAKLSLNRGEDPNSGSVYDGRGPTELGLRYVAWQGRKTVVSVYVGAILAGEGRNAGYADPGAGETDFESRLLAGRSFSVAGRPGFAEIQLARLSRPGLSDESRLDVTLGYEPSPRWLILAQSYSGQARSGAEWTKLEASAVRRFGDWRAQAGWRIAAAGKAGPAESGPVLALWRNF